MISHLFRTLSRPCSSSQPSRGGGACFLYRSASLTAAWLLCFALGAAPTIKAAPWAVEEAPYRALIYVEAEPGDRDFGVAIRIPEFGLMLPDGADAVLTDAQGERLPIKVIASVSEQEFVALGDQMRRGNDYYLYFGSGSRAQRPEWDPKISLLIETRPLPSNARFDSWGEMRSTWERSDAIYGMDFTPDIYDGANPFGPSRNFMTKFTGYLRIDQEQTMEMFTNSSDASFVLFDGQLRLEWPGTHRRATTREGMEEITRRVTLPAGNVRVEYYHAKASDGQPTMVLGWKRGDRWEGLPRGMYQQPGRVEFTRLETRPGNPVPLPSVVHRNYLGYEGYWLVKTELWFDEPPGDAQFQWRFGDGSTHEGPSVNRALVGLDPVRLAFTIAQPDRTVTLRQVLNPDSVTSRASVQNARDVQDYLDMITAETPDQLNNQVLRTYFRFVNEFGNNPAAAPFAIELNERGLSSSDAIWWEAQKVRLRDMAAQNPGEAVRQVQELARQASGDDRREIELFEMELLAYYLRNPDAAGRARQLAFQQAQNPERRRFDLLLGDFFRLSGMTREALEHYQRLQQDVLRERDRELLTVQDRALSVLIRNLLNEGHVAEARKKLLEWELTNPMAKISTDFLLLQARLNLLEGLWTRALRELDSLEALQPDNPYSIEVLFYRSRALYELGQIEEARDGWREIVEKYPRHHLVDDSRRWLDQLDHPEPSSSLP